MQCFIEIFVCAWLCRLTEMRWKKKQDVWIEWGARIHTRMHRHIAIVCVHAWAYVCVRVHIKSMLCCVCDTCICIPMTLYIACWHLSFTHSRSTFSFVCLYRYVHVFVCLRSLSFWHFKCHSSNSVRISFNFNVNNRLHSKWNEKEMRLFQFFLL